MKVTGYYTLEDRIISSSGDVRREAPYLDWLLKQDGDYHVCYHIDHFTACLCRLIGLERWQMKKLIDDGRVKVDSYYLNYIPEIFLSVKQGTAYGGPFIMFSSVHKFIEHTFIEDEAEGLRRAKQALEVGEQVASALVSLELSPSTLVSPIRAWEKERMAGLKLPVLDDMPEKVGEWAYEACKGNWVEAYQRGHWGQAWDWDINSAYPYELSRLPSFEIDDWEKDFDGNPKAEIGVYRCLVDMSTKFHPVLYKNQDDENYTPVSKWEDCLSLKMIRHVEKYKLGKVRIIEGYCLKPGKRLCPLKKDIEYLQKEKDKENGARREVVKRIMTGIYGKLLEVHLHSENTFGQWFNPVWAMEVEGNTRIKVSEFCLDNGVVPLHVAVDGVLVDRDLGTESSAVMGKWRLASCCPALVIGSGQVAVKDKVGVGEFRMDYDRLMEYGIEKQEKLAPMTLAKGLNLNRVDDIGKLVKSEKQIDLNSENKRCYPAGKVRDWEEFLERKDQSIPWDISTVAKIEELV